ncbi:hypothetical protein Tsubulata_049941 [Turnera subulata]|uniref:Uncharacterized protein n=1 Tax=Turnera subulata TaxID=218843 RepID=A0A9Q0G9P4_9ROSI|nr:hypothetical protein Tsubulata_049941 [Turnera subulata]
MTIKLGGLKTPVMNDLSNAALREQNKQSCNPIPSAAIYILATLFVVGVSVSVFILVVVHNAFFFLAFLLLSALVGSFVAWNRISWGHKAAVFCFFNSFPESDLRAASEGQLVKITGLNRTGESHPESNFNKMKGDGWWRSLSYQMYLHIHSFDEYGEFGWRTANSIASCFQWDLTYCESGIRAMVKAGSGCTVVPLIVESKLVTTARQCRNFSRHLRKWLQERHLPAEARLLRLEEGYVQEGGVVTVVGMLHRHNDLPMIVHPQELLSTGCLWHKFFLPVDTDGLIIRVPETAVPNINPGKRERKWEGLLVAPRLGCIEVHGLKEKTHCFQNILRHMVKAIGGHCLRKLEAARRRRSNNNNKNTTKRQKAAAKTEKPKVHLPKPVRLTSLRLQRNDSFECNTNVSTGSSSQEKEVCFGAETVDEVPSWCKYFKNGGGDYENGASFLVEEVNASDDLECQSPGPITNSLEKLYEEYLQLLKTDDDQAQLDSFAESLLL